MRSRTGETGPARDGAYACSMQVNRFTAQWMMWQFDAPARRRMLLTRAQPLPAQRTTGAAASTTICKRAWPFHSSSTTR
jgi:hypothetical protein